MLRLTAMKILLTSILLTLCTAWIPATAALPDTTARAIDSATLAVYSAAHHKPGSVVFHIDLTNPFETRTPWTFVAVQGPVEQNPFDAGKYTSPGQITLCLVHDRVPDCTGPEFSPMEANTTLTWAKDPDYYHELAAGVVFAGSAAKRPLLLLAAHSLPSGDGDKEASTFILAYDKGADRFVGLFAYATDTNMNAAARLIESGPLRGDVIADEPTSDAPFTYFVAVYRSLHGNSYRRLLKYRGKTGYGDGNPLAVIDSEMPEILRRLHLWKMGDPLPVPPVMPAGCHHLGLRRGVEWCN
jgi:hypothetical protein